MRKKSPTLPSYQRCLALMPRCCSALAALFGVLQGQCTGLWIADPTSIRGCDHLRIKRHKVFAGIANDQKVAGIGIRVDFHQGMVLCYRMKSTGEVVEQRVQTQTSPCHLGGQRHWFVCPQCGKRVAVLYAPGRYFVCRQCGCLGYATQKEGAGDRASTRADKLRKRMGWEAGILNGDGGKPKGMHWKTYQRHKAHHDALVQVSLHDMGRKLGFLHQLLEG